MDNAEDTKSGRKYNYYYKKTFDPKDGNPQHYDLTVDAEKYNFAQVGDYKIWAIGGNTDNPDETGYKTDTSGYVTVHVDAPTGTSYAGLQPDVGTLSVTNPSDNNLNR